MLLKRSSNIPPVLYAIGTINGLAYNNTFDQRFTCRTFDIFDKPYYRHSQGLQLCC
jgi:hypothetical protein